MSIWNSAARRTHQAPPSQSIAPSRNQAQVKDGAGPAPAPAASARPQEQDSFTPAPQPGPSASRPVLNPEPVEGYSEPVSPDELPDPGQGTGVLTLNLANGAHEKYRTAENRQAQAELIQDTGARIVGFQEVDVGAGRTGHVHTALDVVRRLNPAFDVFTSGAAVPTVPSVTRWPGATRPCARTTPWSPAPCW
jgi:hypothetical protein